MKIRITLMIDVCWNVPNVIALMVPLFVLKLSRWEFEVGDCVSNFYSIVCHALTKIIQAANIEKPMC